MQYILCIALLTLKSFNIKMFQVSREKRQPTAHYAGQAQNYLFTALGIL